MKALGALALCACAAPAPWQPVSCPQPVVLVTIDGVRREEVLTGRARLPNLYRLIDRGVLLDDVVASSPNHVSLPGYLEIVSGRPPLRCTDNHCGRAAAPTLLDELPRDQVALVGSWETLEDAASWDPETLPMSVGRANGALRRLFSAAGSDSYSFPGLGDYRPDRYTAEVALDYLQSARPCFLWVALGDTDEYAHRGDYPSYLEALRAFDRFLGQLDATLLAMGRSNALVVVTTDHGREPAFRHHGTEPESARVWAVLSKPVEHRPAHLCNLAPTIREILGLPPDRSVDACDPL